MLEVRNLSINFQKKILVDNISFTIKKNEILAIIGESGSGKSITSLAITKLLSEKLTITGDIIFNNNNLLKTEKKNIQKIRGKEISYIFQDPNTNLNPVFTIKEQINETIKQHLNLNAKQRKQKILDLMAMVDLPNNEEFCNRYPHQISGGQKQRILIACALAGETKLLIADEPTTALDVTTQKQILDLLLAIKNKTKMSIIIISHDISVVKNIADYVMVMKDGKKIEEAEKNIFFTQPQHSYSKQLLKQLKREDKLDDANYENSLMTVNNIDLAYSKKSFLPWVKKYLQVVFGVNLNVYSKHNLAIIGESGSGKSTIAKAIIKLLKIKSGSITWQNKEINTITKKEYAKDVQIIFQNVYSSFNPTMTIGNNILYCTKAVDMDKITELNLIDLLKTVGLDKNIANLYPHQLSGGQLQRCTIARALIVKPKLIICDEPTSSLDVSLRKQILDLLLEIQKSQNISFIFITHDIKIVDYFAHDVIVLKDGNIVEKGNTQYVLSNAENDYTKSLIYAANL